MAPPAIVAGHSRSMVSCPPAPPPPWCLMAEAPPSQCHRAAPACCKGVADSRLRFSSSSTRSLSRVITGCHSSGSGLG
jgi:hypothetical protein